MGTEGTDRRCGWAAAGLIAAAAALNVAYLLVGCPHDLAPDEAHYWDWSRHLDWSYYSKGPLVALLIRGSCDLFGGLATQVSGTAMPAVRLPAVACHVLLVAAVYLLTARTFGRPRFALAAVALGLTVPAMTAPSVVMTIDGPLLAAWAWACVFTQQAVVGGKLRHWVLAGLVTAVGMLAKYSMVLFPACVGLYLLADRDRRAELARPGFWAMAAAAALGGVPLLVWNAQHGWVGARHVLALAGLTPPETPVDPGKQFDPTAFRSSWGRSSGS